VSRGRDVHVVPWWDAREHLFSIKCRCRPHRDRGDPNRVVIIHNTWSPINQRGGKWSVIDMREFRYIEPLERMDSTPVI
jgi:hypothetical protein